MGRPDGFAWTLRKNGDVLITHHGRQATVLRGAKADAFVDDMTVRTDDSGRGDDSAAQELMARLTGNYQRGNERQWRR